MDWKTISEKMGYATILLAAAVILWNTFIKANDLVLSDLRDRVVQLEEKYSKCHDDLMRCYECKVDRK